MKEKIKKLFQSHAFLKIIVGLGIVILALVIFLIGEAVGYEKAEFSYRFGENYNRIFEGPDALGHMLPLPLDNMFGEDGGAVGTIIKVNLPQVVLEDQNGTEKIIAIDNQTIIKQFRGSLASTSIRVGDFVTVLGEPDQNGHIIARLIRILPPVATTTQAK